MARMCVSDSDLQLYRRSRICRNRVYSPQGALFMTDTDSISDEALI